MSVLIRSSTFVRESNTQSKSRGFGENEMLRHNTYPMSPSSDAPSTKSRFQETVIETSPETEVDISHSAARPPCALRRDRDPPRNDNGEIICEHSDCSGKREVFRRPCEWNKHMDRHERPYKCREIGCELTLGFTYSGGLLRHQREVHKMHLSTKQPLFCPFPNCNRSSGTGFTRRENLEEHKRRRHVDQMVNLRRPRAPSSSSDLAPQIIEWPENKRRKIVSAEQEQVVPVQQKASLPVLPTQESSEVQMLRHEIAQRDEIIQRQAHELQRLRNMLQSIPAPSIYGVSQSNRSSHV